MANKRRIKLFLEMTSLLGGAALCVFFLAPSPIKAPVVATNLATSTQASTPKGAEDNLQDSYTTSKPATTKAASLVKKRGATKRTNTQKLQGEAPALLRQEDIAVTVSQPEKISEGLTLVPVTGTASVILINNNGTILHRWNIDATRARLLPNGNLLVVHGSKWGLDVEPWRSMRPTVTEYTWNGDVVWSHTMPDIAHHDIQRLDNGNSLFPYRVIVPANDKKSIIDRNRRLSKIRSDSIIEVNSEGETVWEWKAHEHLDLNECGRHACPSFKGSGAAKRSSDWTHINTTSIIPENKWYDKGDSRFKPGNILTLPRNWWTVLLIDKDTKQEVWRYTGDYKGGLSGGHEAHMIEKGLPGAGNILIFDNGRVHHAEESYVLEVNPSTMKLEWVYDVGKQFFSKSAGSMQRFRNGNTLISEDVAGRILEVNKNKEIVWEVNTPFRLSRSKKYSLDYCPQFKQLLP